MDNGGFVEAGTTVGKFCKLSAALLIQFLQPPPPPGSRHFQMIVDEVIHWLFVQDIRYSEGEGHDFVVQFAEYIRQSLDHFVERDTRKALSRVLDGMEYESGEWRRLALQATSELHEDISMYLQLAAKEHIFRQDEPEDEAVEVFEDAISRRESESIADPKHIRPSSSPQDNDYGQLPLVDDNGQMMRYDWARIKQERGAWVEQMFEARRRRAQVQAETRRPPLPLPIPDVELAFQPSPRSGLIEPIPVDTAPIPQTYFCYPYKPLPADCGVCQDEIAWVDAQSGTIVNTRCGHIFHDDCLDEWVNSSAMNNSNTCPQCRTTLCRRRARQHVPVSATDAL